jgi:peptidoglycan/xylan/chitin deacetylase (PgdA/CDA1 family)
MLRPTPSRHGRRGDRLSRRGLLGAAAVVVGAGAADALHHRHGKSTPQASSDGRITPAANSGIAPGGSATPSPTGVGSTSRGTATPSGGHSAPTGTTQGHGPGKTKGSHSHSHGGATEISHERGEQVALPPATVHARTRPIFYVDQLIPDAPKHAIALTIDDGPDPDYTPKVLRLLDKHRMQASFCVVGAHADSYPKLIRDISRAGHVIVNHSYTHVQPFTTQSQARIVAEITRAQRSIEKAAKVTPELFRSPGGDWSPFVFKAVAAYGLLPLDWDVDPDDWEMPGTKAIVRAMLRGRPNDIVICHDGGGDRSETVRALRKVLPTWKHRGYVTIPLSVPSSAKTAISASSTSTPSSSTPTPSSSSTSAQPTATSSLPPE